jgi:hypothetical protein
MRARSPARQAYLSPPADAVAQWRETLDGPGLKVGIARAGSPLHRRFSLQVSERAADLARLPAGRSRAAPL